MTSARKTSAGIFSVAAAVTGYLSFTWDAANKNLEWLIYITGAILLLAAILWLWPVAKRLTIWLRNAINCIHEFDAVKDQRDKARTQADAFRAAAAAWQTRAETAENTWHANSVREGRRRAVLEILAAGHSVLFGEPSAHYDGTSVIVGAKILNGTQPEKGLLYPLRHQPTGSICVWLAVLGPNHDGTATVFRPERYLAMTKDELLRLGAPGMKWPREYGITARATTDDFREEE